MVPRRLIHSLGFLRRATLVVATGVVVACQQTPSLTPGAIALHIVNVDGPAVIVSVDAEQVGTVACGGSTIVTPSGDPPWEIVVETDGGRELYRATTSSALEQGVVIRSDGVRSGEWPVAFGPAGACSS